MTQGSLFAWLHLSDIHIGHGAADHQANQNLVLEALRADVARQIAAGIPKPDVVLVTGDIAFSGACRNKHEYKRAAEWLKKIAGAVELGPEAVFVVPGNHDVQRPVDKPDKEDLLRALRNGKKTVDNVLPDRAIRKYLAARQANYLAFVKGFASACSATEDSKLPPGCWQHSLPRRDRLTVRLCGLNTALLAADEKVYGADNGALQLGTLQIDGLLREDPLEGEVVIVMSHHPFSGGWLQDEHNISGWMRKKAHIHLSGHVHAADNSRMISGGGSELIHVVAGAAHGEKEPKGVDARHGYSFGALCAAGDGVEMHLWARRWSPENNDFRLDVHVVPDGKQYATHPIAGVKLPPPAKVSRETSSASSPFLEGDTFEKPSIAAGLAPEQRAKLSWIGVLKAHPVIRDVFKRMRFGDEDEAIVDSLFRRPARDAIEALNQAISSLDSGGKGLLAARRVVTAMLYEALRFAVDWREIAARARETLPSDPRKDRGANRLDLPVRTEALVELISASVDGRLASFNPQEAAPIGLTLVRVPTILNGPVSVEPEQFVRAIIEHAASLAEFKAIAARLRNLPTSDAAEALDQVLFVRGYRMPEGECRPYYVVFDGGNAQQSTSLWQIASRAQREPGGLPSLRLIRQLDGSIELATGPVGPFPDA